MHHFIYPLKDTYISSRPESAAKNFGLDEILQIGTSNEIVRTLASTKDYTFSVYIFNNYPVQYFTGTFTGSLKGTVVGSYGTLIGVSQLTASYFSGSIGGGAISEYSGTVSGSLDGFLSGSFDTNQTWINLFTGQLTGSVGCLYGTGSGIDTRQQQNWVSTATQYIDRALLQFDLTTISESIALGVIPTPKFHLKLKVSNEYNLPLDYTIYAFPVSQSWAMGNGYFSDGGANQGVSWKYRDIQSNTYWWDTYTGSVRHPIDFISVPQAATASFAMGGGNWFTSSNPASQNFNYEASDINMDVTEIVLQWLSGSLPNNGFILLSSDELRTTGSGFMLKFFSENTNTIYSPYLDAMWPGNGGFGAGAGGSDDFITGSFSTSSVTFATMSAGMTMTIYSGSSFSVPGGVWGKFSGSTLLTTSIDDGTFASCSGILDGHGLGGNIKGLRVVGNYLGTITVNQQYVQGPCGNQFSASFVTASMLNGVFSGSTITAWFTDEQKLENGWLSGSWTPYAWLGTNVQIPVPSGIEPFAYAYVSGPYINGKALGLYEISGSTSASFAGQFIEGPYRGGLINLQLTGSIITSSYVYTSSVTFTTDTLAPLNISQPFTLLLQNVRPEYRVGDIAKIRVFGRKQYPLKTFGVSTQLSQYLVPEFLPTSSYYALRDNETGEIVMDFDNYTRLSCEYPEGNYFVIDTTGIPQERYYRVLVRVENTGEVYTVDMGKVFKITR